MAATVSGSEMKREPPSGIDVLIAGGGLGGLCAAVESYRQGHNVRILEAKPAAEPVGDLLGIGPSVTRQYEKWPGMMETHRKIAFNSVLYFHKVDGELLSGPFSLKLAGAKAVETMPTPVSRPKLMLAMYDYVASLGIPIEFDKLVTDYYEDDERKKAGVVIRGGERMEADLLIAADGVGSKVMRTITGQDSKAKSSGFSVFRVSYPTKRAMEHPLIAKTFKGVAEGGDDINRFYLGNNLHGIVVITPETTIWFLTHQDKKDRAAESWSKKFDASDVLADLDPNIDWDPVYLAIISQSPPQSIVDFKIMWRDPNPKWVSSGGRILALGDSAHSFLPTSANGATQAMEDGHSIAACLKLAGKEDIPLATRVHNVLRFERVSCAQLMGFKNREMLHKTDFEAARKHPQTLVQQVGRWVSFHNPEAYVYERWEECVRHVRDGVPFKNTNIPPGYDYKPWTIDQILQDAEEGRYLEEEGDWS